MASDDASALGLPLIFVGSREDLSEFVVRAWLQQWGGLAIGVGLGGGILGGLLVGGVAARAGAGLANARVEQLLAHVQETLSLGAPVSLVSQARAAQLFKFDVGGVPSAGRIYVRHPHIVDRYLAPEDFAITVARAKEAAVRQLASALGAKKLVLVSGVVHEKAGLFSLSVPIKEVAAEIGIRAEFGAKGEVVRSVYSEFGPPTAPPYIPDDLRPWVEADPDLRTMARTRIEGNLMKDQVRMEFSDSLHLGASVAAKVASVNAGAATEYRRVHRSTWQFEVEYWPKR